MRYEEFVKIQLEKIRKTGIVSADKMPDIGLYMDQTEAFFAKEFKNLDGEVVKRNYSKPLINNYTKRNMVARPDGKKYTKNHLLMITMVIYLKGLFKLENIEKIMKPLVDNHNSAFEDDIDPEIVYNAACAVNAQTADIFSEDVNRAVDTIKKHFEDTDIADDESMEILALVLALSMKADMEKYLASRLMDEYFIKPSSEKGVKINKIMKSKLEDKSQKPKQKERQKDK